MKRIPFHNRERELKAVMKILEAEPSLITFIYGPINSGKTTLVSHLIEQLPEEYVVFYINLRGRFILDYRDFIKVLFKIETETRYKEILKTISEISTETLRFKAIPVAKSVMNALFNEKSYEDVFEFLEEYFTTIAKNKAPVLIIDELQVVGDFVVNGRIVYYFGDDMDNAEDHTLTLPITVRAETDAGAGAELTTGTSESGGSSTPGFAAVVAVIGLLTVYLRRKKI